MQKRSIEARISRLTWSNGRVSDRHCGRRRSRRPCRMIHRRAAEAGFKVKLGCHVIRATGITAYLESWWHPGERISNGGARGLVHRQSVRTTLDQIERITI